MTKLALLFVTGSLLYPVLELLWRGSTHSSMALAGGICLVLINRICREKMRKKSLAAKCAAGSLIITCVEFVFGVTVNLVMGLKVWNYASLPLNILGQVCLPFSAIWFLLTAPALYICKLCCAAANRMAAGFLPDSPDAAPAEHY